MGRIYLERPSERIYCILTGVYRFMRLCPQYIMPRFLQKHTLNHRFMGVFLSQSFSFLLNMQRRSRRHTPPISCICSHDIMPRFPEKHTLIHRFPGAFYPHGMAPSGAPQTHASIMRARMERDFKALFRHMILCHILAKNTLFLA